MRSTQIQKKIKSVALYVISRLYGILSIIFRPFVKIDDNSILFWSWNSRQYSCNPRALSEYLSNNHDGEFKLYWSFKGKHSMNLDDNIIPLKWGSLKYLITALKCKFLISNTRNNIETMLFYKRQCQIYIMTWHAGMSLKRIEKDSVQSIDKRYLKRSISDSKICNLMVSGSEFQTNLFKKSFWFDGEILNCGTPRNDILFSDSEVIRNKLYTTFSINNSDIIVLYAPTFRSKFDPDVISFDWNTIKKAIERKFNKRPILLVRLHPNVRHMANQLKFEFNNEDCIDVTLYPDMQELLVVSNILITDYSSSMFDISLINKPCFLLAKDRNEYDRGFYIPLDQLPFSLAESEKELEMNILNFDSGEYNSALDQFNTKNIRYFEKGIASELIYKWILNKNTNHI